MDKNIKQKLQKKKRKTTPCYCAEHIFCIVNLKKLTCKGFHFPAFQHSTRERINKQSKRQYETLFEVTGLIQMGQLRVITGKSREAWSVAFRHNTVQEHAATRASGRFWTLSSKRLSSQVHSQKAVICRTIPFPSEVVTCLKYQLMCSTV